MQLPRPLVQRLDPKVGYGGEGSVATFEMPRSMLYKGIVLHGKYTDTVSANNATSVQTYGVPIDRIDVVAENGVVLHTVRPTDIIRDKQTFALQPLASMCNPPASPNIGAQTGSFDIPLSFQLDRVKDGETFMLPAWRFEQVQVNVYFTNTHANTMVVGTSVGVVTFQELSIAFQAVVDLPAAQIADPNYLIRNTKLLLRSFKERLTTGAADPEFTIEIPRSADIERLIIMTEDANRSPISTLLNAVSLVENGQVRRFSKVPAPALRSIGSEKQNATLPIGWHIIDFTQPSDTIEAALPATQMNSLDLVLDVAAVTGYARAYLIRKAP